MTLRKKTLVALAILPLLSLSALFLYDRPPGPTGAWLARAGLQPQTVTLAGYDIRYVRTGSGPPLLLLHGFGSSIVTWRDVLPGLARGHEVVALDFPGFGASSLAADLSPGRYRAVVLALMDHVGFRDAALVGHSMGGAVSVLFAEKHPERVGRLVLVDSAGFNLSRAERPMVVRLAGTRWLKSAAEILPLRRLLVTAALRQVFHDTNLVDEERVDEYLAPLARPGTAEAIHSLLNTPDIAPETFADWLRAVRVPALVLWGRQDVWTPVAHAYRFDAALRDARLVVFENCGHLPQEEKPAATLDLLLEFLSEGQGGAAGRRG